MWRKGRGGEEGGSLVVGRSALSVELIKGKKGVVVEMGVVA